MGDDAYRILIIDDEPNIIEFLSYNLKKEGYEIFSALNGRQGIELAHRHDPHLVLLDIMMPEMDGIETCKQLRGIPAMNKTIIAFLTARGEDYSQIAGFEAGGDDYITKPVKPKVLISRIKALLKRYGKYKFKQELRDQADKVIIGDLVIDRERYIVSIKDKELVLPKKEFELLLFISSNPDRVFSREEIFSRVWGNDVIVGDRTIDVHIRKLREKIGDKYISTVKGVGYKFKE